MNKKQEEKKKNNKDQLKESQEKFGVTKINFLEVISESYQTCLKNLKQSFIRFIRRLIRVAQDTEITQKFARTIENCFGDINVIQGYEEILSNKYNKSTKKSFMMGGSPVLRKKFAKMAREKTRTSKNFPRP